MEGVRFLKDRLQDHRACLLLGHSGPRSGKSRGALVLHTCYMVFLLGRVLVIKGELGSPWTHLEQWIAPEPRVLIRVPALGLHAGQRA